MEDYRTMFNKIKEEHVNIRENIKLVGDSISDPQALQSLRKSQNEWSPGRKEILSEKQKRLQQTLASLEEGLQNHFIIEARYLPPFVGELLMRALILEHGEIGKLIDAAKSMAFDMELGSLNHDALLSKEIQIRQTIDGISRQIKEHSSKEEILINMLEKGLKDSGRI